MPQQKLHIDIESFSKTNLKDSGVHRYAQDPSTEILCICWGQRKTNVWVPFWPSPALEAYIRGVYKHGHIEWGPECPVHLKGVIESDEYVLVAHNAEFERTMLNGLPGQRAGFPYTPIQKWRCTAAKAAAHGLPRSLERVGAALDLRVQKNKEGAHVMRQLVKPRKPTINDSSLRFHPEDNLEKFGILLNYCADDVRSERELDQRIPDLPPLEQQVWFLDQKINRRGVRVDLDMVKRIQWAVEEHRVELVKKCHAVSGLIPSQTAKVTEWVRGRGFPIENLQADTVDAAVTVLREDAWLVDPVYNPGVLTVLEARRSFQMKAVAKFEAILRSVCSDDRVRGMFLYHGAATGRWSSLIVQLQNLFKGHDQVDADVALAEILRAGLRGVMERWPDIDPMVVFGCCVRAMLVATPGKQLMCCDYNSIEARVIAWLAGQEDILMVFRVHGLIYEYTAARMNGWDEWDVEGILRPMKDDHPKVRFSGKTAVLACGFQGGHNAIIRAAAQGGVVMEEEQARSIKTQWRLSNPEIVNMWYDLQDCAINAVLWPGSTFQIKTGKIQFKQVGEFLYMKLPSGRKLAYYKPRVDDEGLNYLGIDTFTRRFGRVRTYGGRLAENATQATAADILRRGMFNLEAGGYPLIGTVHDEAITERDIGTGSLEEMSQLMCTMPSCFDGLPLAASGFIEQRYKKD